MEQKKKPKNRQEQNAKRPALPDRVLSGRAVPGTGPERLPDAPAADDAPDAAANAAEKAIRAAAAEKAGPDAGLPERVAAVCDATAALAVPTPAAAAAMDASDGAGHGLAAPGQSPVSAASASGSDAGDDTVPAAPFPAAPAPAAPQAEQAETKEDFQALIRGKYRDDYLRAVSGLLAAQLRETGRYQAWKALRSGAESLRQTYPDFDLDRELEDPTFARLLQAGVDLRTAYEVVRREDLRQARRAARAARPEENGLGRAPAGAPCRPDPRALTPQERRQLRRRAARGEEIVW